MSQPKFHFFAGRSNPALAARIISELKLLNVDMSLGDIDFKDFPEGEILPVIGSSVRNGEVFIFQSPHLDLHSEMYELKNMISSAKAFGASRVHVIMPHLPYARQDRVTDYHEYPTIATIIKDLKYARADSVTAIKIHSDQIQAAFAVVDLPFDNLPTKFLTVRAISEVFGLPFDSTVVYASADVGGAKDTEKAREITGYKVGLAILNKTRDKDGNPKITEVIGDVRGKNVVLIDDIGDTGGTIDSAAETLYLNGAAAVYLVITHPLLNTKEGIPAIERLAHANLKGIIVTDTVVIPADRRLPNMKIISVASLIASAIAEKMNGGSVTQKVRENTKIIPVD